ncbi:MAG TPA: serine hydrolase domain-containing protein [Phenylobacterium sp.]|jgi:CubicO group peptidase (beta-lactamase class C family)|uniref:serine hydrolase domain-containing protein n=1 Tax=Phenylobacterium sp. TaxID=1871053 RepID=UPI002D71A15B|nr:serine hydrolase domain-containing protein [Phenylobacterium sp.]HZZ67763.1 serine hydrolase domain-containing protein [Phenylobacterium sp.]
MSLDRRALMGLGLAGVGIAAAATASAQDASGPVVVEGDGAQRYAAAIGDIRAYAERHMAAYGLPGLTLCVAGPEGTAYLRLGYSEPQSRAPLTSDQLFQIGSISKSFTALCVFHLMEAGKLSLDQDIATLLPGAPLPTGAKISVQNLLNHSAGLPDDAPLFPRGGDGRLWRGFEPGSQWSYSNLGFLMLGTIVERLEGRPLAEVLQARILGPLGMTETKGAILTRDRAAYAHGHSALYGDRAYPRAGPLGPGPWTDVTQGAGCVASTAHDMALYGRWLIAAGQGKGAPILSDAGAKRFTTATIEAPGWGAGGGQYANGLAVVEVGGRKLLHHTGGMLAYNSALHVDPQAGVAAFASTNVGLVPYRPRDITAFVCRRLRAHLIGARITEPPPPAPPRLPDMAPYIGRYVGATGETLTLAASEHGLSMWRGAQAYDFEPEGEDVFISREPAATDRRLVFRRADKAVVRAWAFGEEFVRTNGGGAPVARFSPRMPDDLAALVGFYACDDPWHGDFRVSAQGDRLVVDDVNPLTRLPDGSWRMGEKDWSPERIRFDAVIDGRPTRATASGVDHLRRPIP